MASAGLKPVVAVYSSFLQRAFDQTIHDVCLQNLPVMIAVDTFGTGKVCADDCLARAIPLVFGVTPVQIMESLRLNRPIFRQPAVFGHFGRKEFPWERTDKVLALQDTIL